LVGAGIAVAGTSVYCGWGKWNNVSQMSELLQKMAKKKFFKERRPTC
jgi:hypothetical protein